MEKIIRKNFFFFFLLIVLVKCFYVFYLSIKSKCSETGFLEIKMAQLQITVVEARNLEQKDTFSENDVYVQIYLDDKKQQQKTKTKQNSNNPMWNESLVL